MTRQRDDATCCCFRCGLAATEIADIVALAKAEKMTPDDYVREEEGTFNPANGHFACDGCYIEIGMPSRPAPGRWVAP